MPKALLTILLFFVISVPVNAEPFSEALGAFRNLYTSRFADVMPCPGMRPHEYRLCSEKLRNDGNGPFILHHGEAQANTVVLVHGLSDSPFFMRAIANALYVKGFNVIVPLLPGHGQKEADDDMEDAALATRWQQHVADVIALAPTFGRHTFTGGFSTGGALVVDNYLTNPSSTQGILLFSGALALSEDAENMSRIWGIKWVAKIIDGDYETAGPNPYKYPSVAGFAGLELMDVIKGIRNKFAQGATIDVPLFVAHSAADATTPISGVKTLISHTKAANNFFIVDERYDLCHADLVVSEKLVADMHFDKRGADTSDKCAIPKANPLFRQMMATLDLFVTSYQGE